MHLVSFGLREEVDAPGSRTSDRRSGSMGDAALGFETLDAVRPGSRRIGAILELPSGESAVADLNRAFAVKLAFDDVGAPEAEADSMLPSDALGFLRRLPGSLDAARAALEFIDDALGRYDAPDVLRAGIVNPRRSVHLSAPVPRPGKIVCVARNYHAHALERGDATLPEEPALFLKAPSAVIGPEDAIVIPEATKQVDYEGELAAVIGRRAHRVPAARALEHVAGYCIANDVSARDYQNTRGQTFIGKSCDSFAPMGPALVTADEVAAPWDLAIHTTVSGERLQSGRTKEMVFPLSEIIAFASRLFSLDPGDVVLTGTPSGVGAAQTPPRWLRDGDVVEVEIEGLGRLRNYVREERSRTTE